MNDNQVNKTNGDLTGKADGSLVKKADGQAGRPHWTIRQVIVGQTLNILVLTILLRIFFFRPAGYLLETFFMSLGMYWALGTPVRILLYLALIAAAIALLLLVSNLRLAFMSEAEAKVELMEKARFKWSYAFSALFGYFLVYVLLRCTVALCERNNSSLVFLLGLVISIAVSVFAAKLLNQRMVRITKANQEAIEDFTAGCYDSEIPPQFRNQADILAILNILSTAQATTVKGAVLLYRIQRVLFAAGRRMAAVGKVLFVATAVLTMGFSLGMRNAAINAVDDGLKDIGREMRSEDYLNRLADKIARRL